MQRTSVRMVIGFVAVGLIVVGSIGPWVSSPLGSVSGMNGDGKWTLVACLPALAGLLRQARPLVGIVGLIVGAVALYDGTHINDRIQKFNVQGLAQVGWGVWLVGIGGAALLAAAIGPKSMYGAHLRSDEATESAWDGRLEADPSSWDARPLTAAGGDFARACSQCGLKAASDDRFCSRCGSPLRAASRAS